MVGFVPMKTKAAGRPGFLWGVCWSRWNACRGGRSGGSIEEEPTWAAVLLSTERTVGMRLSEPGGRKPGVWGGQRGFLGASLLVTPMPSLPGPSCVVPLCVSVS